MEVEIRDLLLLTKIVFGASWFNGIGASCYDCNTAGAAHTDGSASELCADND